MAMKSPYEPVRKPVEGDGRTRGSVNTTVSAEPPSDSAMPDGIKIITD
jgi:hypothetical protein